MDSLHTVLSVMPWIAYIPFCPSCRGYIPFSPVHAVDTYRSVRPCHRYIPVCPCMPGLLTAISVSSLVPYSLPPPPPTARPERQRAITHNRFVSRATIISLFMSAVIGWAANKWTAKHKSRASSHHTDERDRGRGWERGGMGGRERGWVGEREGERDRERD